jgi:protein ImuB
MSTPSSPRRFLAVWLKSLATDRIARGGSPAPADMPLVTVAPVKSALRLMAVNAPAVQRGLMPGMALADARAMYPTLAVAEADPHADHCLLEAIADWCDRYTPLVGLDPPDGLLLDITGCAHLFGGEAALGRDLVMRLEAFGFAARVAGADTVGCAWGVARYGQHAAMKITVVPPGGTDAALRSLPLAALRLPSDMLDALAQVGLKRIDDVAARPRAPLAARFGELLVQRIDQALGAADEPITPRLPIPPYVAERRFAEPIALEADVLNTSEHLARDLNRVLERRGDGARLLQLALFRTDGKVHRIEVGTSEPVRDAARIRRLFTDKLAAIGEAWDPGFGFDMARLCVLVAEPLAPAQANFVAPDASADLAHLIDRLGARFGLRRVARLMPQDTHIPEFAVAAVPAHAVQANSPPARKADPLPDSLPARGERENEEDDLAPARPIRLFARPEPIEAIAEVPDGPPVRFRWRQVLHEVAHVEGPERIAMEWWRNEAGEKLTRDYFRVESKAGARVWLYREGLYERETPRPRWFLHGLFA